MGTLDYQSHAYGKQHQSATRAGQDGAAVVATAKLPLGARDPPAASDLFGRFPNILLPRLQQPAFLVNRLSVLISNGDLGIQRFIADGAKWRLAEKIQDYWHWAASEKGKSDRTRDRGAGRARRRDV
jgi:hypothetical protein